MSDGKWNWLVGRILSAGKVLAVRDEAALILRNDVEYIMQIPDLLYEDFRDRDINAVKPLISDAGKNGERVTEAYRSTSRYT